ncbi:winged helix-turn-helix domain-containing protein [Enhygromyxa salina]|nr:crosslink repair DNA glycosylase YcaQ family protein [Enhygromyxa salina]
MARLGLIQLDSVNVCARSHYMPFYARLGAYDQQHLDTWLNTRERHFEYWAHEASVMPVEQYPLWRWRMAEWRRWKRAELVLQQHPKLERDVLRQVSERGPISVKQLIAPSGRTKPWWGYGPGKIALETLFGEGKLTALRGKGFTRLYDLPERAIPKSIRLDDRYDKHLAHHELLLRATRHLGIGTARDIADYHRLQITVARPMLAELAAAGHIDEVAVNGWKGPVYRDPAARCPRAIRGATLLSPFDPLTWNRARAERIFNFRYRIEIYTPREKREYGYYVLPFMLDGELVARVDLKADRQGGTLRVPSAFIEPGRDKARVAKALATELERFATWLGLGSVSLGRKGDLIRDLRRAST